jgi:hypothetical protein
LGRTDHVEQLGVGTGVADSGQPVVAAGDLPGNVLLGTSGVHVDDFPLAFRVHYDCVLDDGDEVGLRVGLDKRSWKRGKSKRMRGKRWEREIGKFGGNFQRHDGVCACGVDGEDVALQLNSTGMRLIEEEKSIKTEIKF